MQSILCVFDGSPTMNMKLCFFNGTRQKNLTCILRKLFLNPYFRIFFIPITTVLCLFWYTCIYIHASGCGMLA